MRLKDQVAIITGATSGLGEAIAYRFAKEGAKVAVIGRDQERGEKVVSAIRASGGEGVFFRADLTVDEDVQYMVQSVVKCFGTINILVNNAGLVIPGNIINISPSDWDKSFQTNVTSAYLVSHYAMPYLLREQKGSVINISSEAGLKGFANRAAYSAAKSALIGLTKAMAVDHSPSGIRVNCICPGTIETPMVQRTLANHENPEQLKKEFLQRRLTPSLGTPEDIAEAAVYFALPDNLYVTGAVLSVDGGALAK